MEMKLLSLSVLVPVYNEEYLIRASLARLGILAQSDLLSRIEVIVVDDGSSDRTPKVLAEFRGELESGTADSGGSKLTWTFLRHERNGGKGAAIRTALARATGDITVVHDADLEYDPRDLLRIVQVFSEQAADAVFGSRFAGGEVRRALFYRHTLGNKFLTFLANLVCDLNLTDVWTCYKAVRTPLLQSIPMVSNDFRIEPELTIRLAKRNARIFEVPISYAGRTYQEGKKIGLRDALLALWAIIRFGLSDNIFVVDKHLSQILSRLARASRFNAWMADCIRPYCGERILEIGSGTGNLTLKLIPRLQYVVSDINPFYLQSLQNLCDGRPYLRAAYCDISDGGSFPIEDGGYDSIICLNVIEHIDDDKTALLNVRKALAPDGQAIVLVPQGSWNFGTLDEVLGHKRRYSARSLALLAEECGLEVRELIKFNRTGAMAWFLNGRILRRRHFGLGQIWLLNALTPIIRRIDRVVPSPPLSLIAVMQRKVSPTIDAYHEGHDESSVLKDPSAPLGSGVGQ
jgi:glycosyltransferase involved in cell wall biosynthesis